MNEVIERAGVAFTEVSLESVLLDAGSFENTALLKGLGLSSRCSLDRSPRSIPLREKARYLRETKELRRSCQAMPRPREPVYRAGGLRFGI